MQEQSLSKKIDIGLFGVYVLIISLSVLFAASIVGFIIIGARFEAWPPEGTPPFPIGLWFSTVVLLISSATIYLSLRAINRGKIRVFKGLILLTLFLGFAFLGLQVFNWAQLLRLGVTAKSHLFGFMFYVLTVLHAAHVLGGLVPLTIVTKNAVREVYTQNFHPGLTYTSIYWHFLDIVWVIIFILLFISWR